MADDSDELVTTPASADAAAAPEATPDDEPLIDDPLAPVVAATTTPAAKVAKPAVDGPGEPLDAIASSGASSEAALDDGEKGRTDRGDTDGPVDGGVPGGDDPLDDDVTVVDLDDDDDDDGYDEEGDPPRRRGGLLTKQVEVKAVHILLGAVVVALAVGAYVLGQRQGQELAGTPGRPATTATTEFVQPKDWVPFEDKETGIKLSIPGEWQQRSTKNLGAAARMFAQVPNSDDTLLVRVNSYSKEVTAANLGDQKAVIDSIFAREKIAILGVEPGELRGMPVLVYIYSFSDAEKGTGIHAHYFVFQGRKAVQMVFQALPQDHYTRGGLGSVWSKITESLEITPGDPPAFLEQLDAAPTPTTAAPAAPPTSG